MSRGVWKAVETSVREVRMGEAERRRSEGRGRKKERRKGEEEETEKGEDDGGKESSRRVGNIGQGRESDEVRSRGEKIGAREVSQIDKDVWKEAVRKNANKKNMGSCDRGEGGVHTIKREGIPFVERGEGGSKRICEGTTKEGIHPAI